MNEQIPFVKNITGMVSDDGTAIAIEVTTKDGSRSKFAFTPSDASKFLSLVVSLAQEAGTKTATPMPRGPITAHPIDVSALGIGPGRSETEAALSVMIGPMIMVFSVQLSMLMEQLDATRAKTSSRPPQSPH